jgi:hypothetical protein
MPTWSHDGRWIYFLSDRTGDLQVWKASPGGGEAVRVTPDGGSSPAFESSDGAYIYYQKRLGVPGLWRMHADGGAEELVSDRRWPYLFDPSVPWAIADDGVYFQKDADGVETIAFYSFATRTVTRIVKAENLTSIGVAPVGRSLYYTCTDRYEFNMVLVDNIGL